MTRKRASSGQAVRPAFGRVDLGDGDLAAPARQSRPDEADQAAQKAALAYARKLEADAIDCRFCGGEFDQGDGRVIHDRACPLR